LFGPGLPDPSQTALTDVLDGQNRATLTATVTSTDGIIPQGTVTFYLDRAELGVVGLQNGQAGFTTDVLPAGQHTFTAVYSGDASHNISIGQADPDVGAAPVPSFSVNPPVKGSSLASDHGMAPVGPRGMVSPATVGANPGPATSRTASSHNPASVNSGAAQLVQGRTQTTLAASADAQDQVNLVATVSANGAIPLDGSVAFYQGTALLAISPLRGGQAQATTGALTVGRYALTAVYLGDDFHQGSHDNIDLHVQARTDSHLEVDPGAALKGRAVSLRARVSRADGSAPEGTMDFRARGQHATIDLGRAAVGPDGTARLTATFTAAGPQLITATFTPASADDTPSTSAPILIQVRDGSPLGAMAAYRTVIARRGGIGAGPDRGSPASPAAIRSTGRQSTSGIAGTTDRVKILPQGSVPPVPDAVVVFDEALGRWAESQVGDDYADLAVAMLSDVDPASVRGGHEPASGVQVTDHHEPVHHRRPL